MRVLLDHCVDIRYKALLIGHDVFHTKEMGWEELSNGKLLAAAEENGFEVFLTVDKNIQHQQNIGKRNLVLVTLGSVYAALDDIAPLAPKVIELLNGEAVPGTSYIVKENPPKSARTNDDESTQ